MFFISCTTCTIQPYAEAVSNNFNIFIMVIIADLYKDVCRCIVYDFVSIIPDIHYTYTCMCT